MGGREISARRRQPEVLGLAENATVGADVAEGLRARLVGRGLKASRHRRSNSAQGSTDFDLAVAAPRDTNVYDGNTFGTIDPYGHQPL